MCFKYAIYTILLYYILTYIIVCLLNINKHIGKILRPIIFIGSYLFLLMNLYCIKTYNCIISYDIMEIIKGTNIREVLEYLQVYLSLLYMILFFVLLFLGVALYFTATKIQFKTNAVLHFCLQILLLVALAAIWHNPAVIKDVLIRNRWIIQGDEMISLEYHLTNPKISTSENTLPPQYVVIIIGESFAPSHSSLYGYGKETNPLLKGLVDCGNLIVYNHVTSPMTHTKTAFRYILNTFRLGMEQKSKWYDTPSLIEVMTTADYHTIWLSNQEEYGMFDNLPSGHSKICNDAIFMTADADGNKYDGALIDIELSNSNQKQAVFYHLMGQHYKFKDRYPGTYDIFEYSDYQQTPPLQHHQQKHNQHQSEWMAEYDNATLYNDWVVYSIIDKYKDWDTIIFYLSDHGLDIFDTDPEYCGHAKHTPESQAIGKKIPFMVYLSPKYQQIRPEATERIQHAVNKAFCTDKFIYAVMDAVGIKFMDNDDVARYSLFNGNE